GPENLTAAVRESRLFLDGSGRDCKAGVLSVSQLRQNLPEPRRIRAHSRPRPKFGRRRDGRCTLVRPSLCRVIASPHHTSVIYRTENHFLIIGYSEFRT